MKRFIPVIVSTLEGMQNACRDSAKVIYVENRLAGGTIEKLADARGYQRVKKGRRGVFYLHGCVGEEYEIWDPMEIL